MIRHVIVAVAACGCVVAAKLESHDIAGNQRFTKSQLKLGFSVHRREDPEGAPSPFVKCAAHAMLNSKEWAEAVLDARKVPPPPGLAPYLQGYADGHRVASCGLPAEPYSAWKRRDRG